MSMEFAVFMNALERKPLKKLSNCFLNKKRRWRGNYIALRTRASRFCECEKCILSSWKLKRIVLDEEPS